MRDSIRKLGHLRPAAGATIQILTVAATLAIAFFSWRAADAARSAAEVAQDQAALTILPNLHPIPLGNNFQYQSADRTVSAAKQQFDAFIDANAVVHMAVKLRNVGDGYAVIKGFELFSANDENGYGEPLPGFLNNSSLVAPGATETMETAYERTKIPYEGLLQSVRTGGTLHLNIWYTDLSDRKYFTEVVLVRPGGPKTWRIGVVIFGKGWHVPRG
jgi:hypothetical protein